MLTDLRLLSRAHEQHERSCKLKHIVILTHDAVRRVSNLLCLPTELREVGQRKSGTIRVVIRSEEKVRVGTGYSRQRPTRRFEIQHRLTSFDLVADLSEFTPHEPTSEDFLSVDQCPAAFIHSDCKPTLKIQSCVKCNTKLGTVIQSKFHFEFY